VTVRGCEGGPRNKVNDLVFLPDQLERRAIPLPGNLVLELELADAHRNSIAATDPN